MTEVYRVERECFRGNVKAECDDTVTPSGMQEIKVREPPRSLTAVLIVECRLPWQPALELKVDSSDDGHLLKPRQDQRYLLDLGEAGEFVNTDPAGEHELALFVDHLKTNSL